MIGVFVAAGCALMVSILVTPFLIRYFVRKGFGQEIREDVPSGHASKRGTPTMGGVAILLALWIGYLVAHLANREPPTVSAILVLGLTTVLGVVGFVYDFIKIRKSRNLGLDKKRKIVGQVAAATAFGVLTLQLANARGLTPGSASLSFVRDIAFWSVGAIGFVVLANLIVIAWSNAVNLTDGLDGLAAGLATLVLAVYVIVAFWQFRNPCDLPGTPAGCYVVRDPLDVAVVAAAAMGACAGFLWWNAKPARIFMGDTGSLALGGLLAGLSVVTRTHLLLVVVGGVVVAEVLSVAIQIVGRRCFGRRPFRTAPFHHHFENCGWDESTVVIRFWLLGGICAAAGLGLFYGDWLAATES